MSLGRGCSVDVRPVPQDRGAAAATGYAVPILAMAAAAVRSVSAKRDILNS